MSTTTKTELSEAKKTLEELKSFYNTPISTRSVNEHKMKELLTVIDAQQKQIDDLSKGMDGLVRLLERMLIV